MYKAYLLKRAEVVEKLKQIETTAEKYAKVEHIAKEVGLVQTWLRSSAAEELVIESLK